MYTMYILIAQMRFQETIKYAQRFKPLFGPGLDDFFVVYIPGINFLDSSYSNLRVFRSKEEIKIKSTVEKKNQIQH